MTLTIHTFSGAPRGWRVLLGLAFKGLDFDTRLMSAADKDHHKPQFLALNPRATAPVLETGDGVLRDSIAILGWLDRAYPDRPLFGATPQQAAEIWQTTMECCDYLRQATDQLLRKVFASDGSVPANGSPERLELQRAAELFHAECLYLENILADGRPYLGGDRPSAADAVAFPEIRLLQRGADTKPDLMSALGFTFPLQAFPKLGSWLMRLNDDPAVATTMPPHWT